MGSLVCPCCCCCYSRAAVRRLHWTAFSSQREWVWQLTQFPVARKERPGMNRISHPDWVKLSVELNLRAKPKYEISLHYRFNKRVLKRNNKIEMKEFDPWYRYFWKEAVEWTMSGIRKIQKEWMWFTRNSYELITIEWNWKW